MGTRSLFDADAERQAAAEDEIKAKQREVKYDLRDFTVDYLVDRFRKDLFYIPPYQRKFIWRDKNRSRFIESVLLGLPIPMMFVADMDDGRLEIVDGAQRIQTLESFMSNDIKLGSLERLPALNGFTFSDLSTAQQRKFGTKALRLVVLEDTTSAETRQEIFDRVNTSGVQAKPSEIRRGAFPGAFMSFIKECSTNALFRSLCPIGKSLEERYEHEELVLRYFAYSDNYASFRHDVEKFLTAFVKQHKSSFPKVRYTTEFETMLTFVKTYFPYGFARGPKASSTPRVRFEAISVGVTLALRTKPGLIPLDPCRWLDSKQFSEHTTTHASNSLPRLRNRVEYVRNALLEGA